MYDLVASELVAHQGGWDELAMVAAPLLVFAAVLFLANRRANAKLASSKNEASVDPAGDRGTSGSA